MGTSEPLKIVGALTVVLLLILACGGPPPPLRVYTPMSDLERDAFANADRTVFPDDVRAEPEEFDSTIVAWPGILRAVEYDRTGGLVIATMALEHHYYNWVEKSRGDKDLLALAGDGEGMFVTSWRMTEQTYRDRPRSAPGNLIIVYGTPSGLSADTITVAAACIRELEPKRFRIDETSVGRPATPAGTP